MTPTLVQILQRAFAGGALLFALSSIPASAASLFPNNEPEFAYNDIPITSGYDLDFQFQSAPRVDTGKRTGMQLLTTAGATSPEPDALVATTGCGLIALSTLSRRFRKPS